MLSQISAAEATYRRSLGDGLVLRWSNSGDTENIAYLASHVFRQNADDAPNEGMLSWIRSLMSNRHPLMSSNDFGVIEDLNKKDHPIVACMCLLRREWLYEGLPFVMGQPEIVATDPAYRNRGLIRALFEMVHARSEAEGHPVQGITGIQYFYRQFGYEYALNLGGYRTTFLSLIPALKAGEHEQYTLRDITEEDCTTVLRFYNNRQSDSLVWTKLTEDYLHFRVNEWRKDCQEGQPLAAQMIIDASGNPVGFVHLQSKRWSKAHHILQLETATGINLQAMVPSVLRALKTIAEQMPPKNADTEVLSEIQFHLGLYHPFYDALGSALAPVTGKPYAWYVRVPDVIAFLKLITPVLEKRLAGSVFAGYSGTIKYNCYRYAFQMHFEQGKLVTIEPWTMPLYGANPEVLCPPLVFLQLLFGHRSLDQLHDMFPDVQAKDDVIQLIKVRFPARPSNTLG